MPQHHSAVASLRSPANCISSACLDHRSKAIERPSARLKIQSTLVGGLVAALLAVAAGNPAFAQGSTDRINQQTPADIWRATSRLGYAPTMASAEAARPHPKAWALQQIDAAYAASQRPAALPAELADVGKPLGEVVRGYQAERETRRLARNVAATGSPATASMERATAGGIDAAPVNFSRDMAQAAAGWRIASCSNPALEQPLLARMTAFWFNHLNVFVGKGTVRPFVGNYLMDAIRPHALGRFEDLLLASARHPAMLFYLDQASSNARGINENYARELMELHTMGVNSGYTQADVRELARILTGWTVPLQRGEGFAFNNRQHDQGPKILLGQTFNANGVREGEDAIRLLARQPATAARIATRLAETFVADQPSKALVDQLAGTFLATQGDISAVMKVMVASPEFWNPKNVLFKTPLDFACSSLTAAGGVREKRDIQQALGFLSQAGQAMHGWQTPDGYKTSAATWLAPEALTRRADFALALGNRLQPQLDLDAYLSAATRERIAAEPAPTRAGLTLASPDFMRK